MWRIQIRTALSLSIALCWPLSVVAQSLQADLRQYTEHAARIGDVILPEPKIDWEEDPIRYAFRHAIPVDPATDPMDIPLNAQFIVTAIRKYRSAPNQRRFWEPVLGRVENEIAEMLSVIHQKKLKGNSLIAALEERSNRIERIYGEELTRLAKENGKTGAGRPVMMQFYEVDLLTEPKGGLIRYMPAGRWNLYIFMTQQKKRADYPKPEWITIRQTEKVRLFGKNWFHIQWPNKVERMELVRITRGDPITFTPVEARSP